MCESQNWEYIFCFFCDVSVHALNIYLVHLYFVPTIYINKFSFLLLWKCGNCTPTFSHVIDKNLNTKVKICTYIQFPANFLFLGIVLILCYWIHKIIIISIYNKTVFACNNTLKLLKNHSVNFYFSCYINSIGQCNILMQLKCIYYNVIM